MSVVSALADGTAAGVAVGTGVGDGDAVADADAMGNGGTGADGDAIGDEDAEGDGEAVDVADATGDGDADAAVFGRVFAGFAAAVELTTGTADDEAPALRADAPSASARTPSHIR